MSASDCSIPSSSHIMLKDVAVVNISLLPLNHLIMVGKLLPFSTISLVTTLLFFFAFDKTFFAIPIIYFNFDYQL